MRPLWQNQAVQPARQADGVSTLVEVVVNKELGAPFRRDAMQDQACLLPRYQALFPPSQLKVFLYDDWREHPLHVWHQVLDFLGLDDVYTPDFSETINPTRIDSAAFRV